MARRLKHGPTTPKRLLRGSDDHRPREGFQIFETATAARAAIIARPGRRSISPRLRSARPSSSPSAPGSPRSPRPRRRSPARSGMLIAELSRPRRPSRISRRARAPTIRRVFDYLKPIADTPLVTVRQAARRPHPRQGARVARAASFANDVKAGLSVLFALGRRSAATSAANPAAGIKDMRRQKGAPDANRPWSDEERDAVLDGAAGAHAGRPSR